MHNIILRTGTAATACAVQEVVFDDVSTRNPPGGPPAALKIEPCLGVRHVVCAGYACAARRPHYGDDGGRDRPAHTGVLWSARVLNSVRWPSDVPHAFVFDFSRVFPDEHASPLTTIIIIASYTTTIANRRYYCCRCRTRRVFRLRRGLGVHNTVTIIIIINVAFEHAVNAKFFLYRLRVCQWTVPR